MLSQANDQFSIRTAGSEIQVLSLVSQLELAAERKDEAQVGAKKY